MSEQNTTREEIREAVAERMDDRGLEQVEGIDVEVGNKTDTFVYELRVPLFRDENHPYAQGIDNISSVGVGFETVEIDMQRMQEGTPGRSGGMRGGGAVKEDTA